MYTEYILLIIQTHVHGCRNTGGTYSSTTGVNVTLVQESQESTLRSVLLPLALARASRFYCKMRHACCRTSTQVQRGNTLSENYKASTTGAVPPRQRIFLTGRARSQTIGPVHKGGACVRGSVQVGGRFCRCGEIVVGPPRTIAWVRLCVG